MHENFTGRVTITNGREKVYELKRLKYYSRMVSLNLDEDRKRGGNGTALGRGEESVPEESYQLISQLL